MLLWLLFLLLIAPSRTQDSDNSIRSTMSGIGTIIKNIFSVASGGMTFSGDMMDIAISEELQDTTPSNQEEYDFIVIGAGSAGAAIAGRLSEIPNATILLIEAGAQENLVTDIPILAPYLQFMDSIMWSYKTEPSPNYCRGMINHQCNWPRAKIMGGCSVFNFMAATRGNRRDYDQWAAMGNVGWSYQDLLPYFKKMENIDVRDTPLEDGYHHKGGPVNIGSAPYRTPLSTAFLEAAQEVGFSIVDYDGEEQNGFSYLHSTVKNGERLSSNRAYLYPCKNRTNLFLTRDSHADKILIDPETKKAYGVKFTKGDNIKRTRTVHARKEIIVSAGAINSPKLLMLSGIGPAEHLQELEIDVIQDLKGVGENLMDHMSYWNLNYFVNQSSSINLNRVLSSSNPALGDYLSGRVGPLTATGGIEAVGFVDVDNLASRNTVSNMEILFAGLSVGSDPLFYKALGISKNHYRTTFASMLNSESFMILPTLIAPKSKGKILLQSTDPEIDPKIYPNHFSHPEDVRIMTKGIKLAHELTKTYAMQRFNTTLCDTPILGCENFQKNSDSYWDCAIRTFSSTLYHPTGTCKMGPTNDPTAVVDPRLKVIGIKGLRVADGSIMPIIMSGHPNVPIMMIGEKLADMVKEDWGYI